MLHTARMRTLSLFTIVIASPPSHQSLRLAILSLCPELSRCRRNVSDARRRPQLTRRSENGALSSVRLMPTTCDEDLLGLATDGISTKCSSKSMDAFITFGVQLIRMATYWIFWSRAGGQEGAKKFFRKLLKGLRYVPRVIVTDKLRSYSAARAEIMPSVEHVQQKYQNNRAENSHQPTRLREGRCAVQVSGTCAAFSLSLRSHYVTLPSWETSV